MAGIVISILQVKTWRHSGQAHGPGQQQARALVHTGCCSRPRRAASQPLFMGTQSWYIVWGHRHCCGNLHAHPCPSPSSAHTWDHRPVPTGPSYAWHPRWGVSAHSLLFAGPKVVPLGPGRPIHTEWSVMRPWVETAGHWGTNTSMNTASRT